MSRKLEVSFQIDEDVLATAILEIRQAFGQMDPLSAFDEVYELMDAIGDADRFEVDDDDKEGIDE